MSKIIRYFHIRPYMQLRGGYCVKVTGDTDFIGQVDVQSVKCSKKDAYCKKTGRSLADVAPVKIIPLRNLPYELEQFSTHSGPIDYNFAIRYFLPKE